MILFYNPKATRPRNRRLPLSVLAIAAVVEGKEEYAIVDGNLDPHPTESLVAQIEEQPVELLAVTVMPGPQTVGAVASCREIRSRFPRLPIVWLNARFVPASVAIHVLGAIPVSTGLGFAAWARVHLGRNWSGEITLKQEHELIRSGPYGLVRHPIYSGLLAAMLGTAIVIGEWRALIALAFFAGAVLRRVSVEQRWLSEIFPDDYSRYRREVPALVPFLRGRMANSE